MTLLTIIQDAANDIGLVTPDAVINSTDNTLKTLLRMADKEGYALNKRYEWQNTKDEVILTTVSATSQGNIFTITSITAASVTGMSSPWDYIINDTIWDRTQRRPVFGPLGAQHWQGLIASSTTGPYSEYRIRRNSLITIPVPPAGNKWAFEIKSKFWCENSTGQGQKRWLADTDVGRLDEEIMTQGIIWRYKSAKGLDYAEDFNTYERNVLDAMAQDGGKMSINMGGDAEFTPFINVPDGSWNL
jgi:hypothetical protein|tara:strand:+ start:1547 stop:2281 length:735 start_codon:yes stop_codon:yes gene_type:complete